MKGSLPLQRIKNKLVILGIPAAGVIILNCHSHSGPITGRACRVTHERTFRLAAFSRYPLHVSSHSPRISSVILIVQLEVDLKSPTECSIH